ncbi:MAG: hypothetical protein VX012_06620 [Planctomycetota bacterium]|nr:hypothetical protein [Planctomycetota bacterium]
MTASRSRSFRGLGGTAASVSLLFGSPALLLELDHGSASRAAAQDTNPYGTIDPVDSSISVLRRAVGNAASPAALRSLDELDPPMVDRLLEACLDHAAPSMRTAAMIALAERGGDPIELAARSSEIESNSAFVIGLLGGERLAPAIASRMLDADLAFQAGVEAILLARRGRPADLEALDALATGSEAGELARGVAALALEGTRPGRVAAWIESMTPSETTDRVIFEVTEIGRRLATIEGLAAIAEAVSNRPANDGLRAAAVLSLLELDGPRGIRAWEALATDGSDIQLIPTSLLLLASETTAPSGLVEKLPREDPLQVAIASLVLASPETRPTVASEAVSKGHVPTMRWFVGLPDDRMDRDTLAAIIDAGITRRRSGMIPILLDASAAMGRIDPDALTPRIEAAIERNDPALVQILLRGLVQPGRPDAAAAARPFLDVPDRATRSLATLAVSFQSDGEDELVRPLGRIAGGGGGLPEDLRPLAAWRHLVLSGRAEEALPGILAP